MGSWRKVVDFSQPLDSTAAGGGADEVVTYRVAQPLPVIVFDRETGQRCIVPMQWGFPHWKNPKRPQPIHARSETIEETGAFRDAFIEGQRGIVVMRTFNEGEEITPTRTQQWTIDPRDGIPRGFAFLWRRFDMESLPGPMNACVMVTVPASKLISRITDRMPAILADEDWRKWLGEEPATTAELKAMLRTVEGVNWQMMKEPPKPKAAKPGSARPKPEPEPGLF